MTTTITESVGLHATPGHRYRARLIEGDRWGSSGYYPREMLERDGPTVWPAGTQVYIDHPSAREQHDRPERSVRDLAGKITSTPIYEGDGLYADVDFYPHIAPVIEAMWTDIGMSIRASGTAESGERDGRTGPVITSLTEGVSVDVVTKAGAGGRLVSLLESARTAVTFDESLPGGLTAGDLETRLDELLGPDQWVLDLTDEWIVYRRYEDGEGHLVQQTYSSDPDGRVALTGTPTRVHRRVTYDAAQDPPSVSAGVAMESHERKEPVVAQIQIDEAEHKRLTEAAEKTAKAEAQVAEAVKRAEEAEAQIAAANEAADTAAADRIIAAHGQFTTLEAKGLRADLPRTEAGRLDQPAFERAVKEAAAEKAEAAGAGRPSGFGASESDTEFTEADLDKVLGIQKGDR